MDKEMETLKNIDVSTGMSLAALFAVAADHMYFEKRINKVEDDLKMIKESLAKLVEHVDPETQIKIQRLSEEVGTLGNKLTKEIKEEMSYTRLTGREDINIENGIDPADLTVFDL